MKRGAKSEIYSAFEIAESSMPSSLMVAQLISNDGTYEKSEKVFIHQ